MTDELLTTGQAAIQLGVSRSTVVRHIDAGHINAYRLPGGHWRISKSVIEELRRTGLATAGDDAGIHIRRA